jgi:hypothetical protein
MRRLVRLWGSVRRSGRLSGSGGCERLCGILRFAIKIVLQHGTTYGCSCNVLFF